MSFPKPWPEKDLLKLVQADGNQLRVVIRGLGSVPSLKNAKRVILDRQTNMMRPMTEGRVQKWMAKAIHSLKYQLIVASQRIASATLTEPSPRSWTALLEQLAPLDDRRQCVTKITIRNVQVGPGEEGADILITRLPDREPKLFPD